MRTYDAWFPRYALGNGLMFFCRVFSPAVGRGSSALSTFLDRCTQRVKNKIITGFSSNGVEVLTACEKLYDQKNRSANKARGFH